MAEQAVQQESDTVAGEEYGDLAVRQFRTVRADGHGTGTEELVGATAVEFRPLPTLCGVLQSQFVDAELLAEHGELGGPGPVLVQPQDRRRVSEMRGDVTGSPRASLSRLDHPASSLLPAQQALEITGGRRTLQTCRLRPAEGPASAAYAPGRDSSPHTVRRTPDQDRRAPSPPIAKRPGQRPTGKIPAGHRPGPLPGDQEGLIPYQAPGPSGAVVRGPCRRPGRAPSPSAGGCRGRRKPGDPPARSCAKLKG
jgi:hypothetical protein